MHKVFFVAEILKIQYLKNFILEKVHICCKAFDLCQSALSMVVVQITIFLNLYYITCFVKNLYKLQNKPKIVVLRVIQNIFFFYNKGFWG